MKRSETDHGFQSLEARLKEMDEEIVELREEIGHRADFWINDTPCHWEGPGVSIHDKVMKLCEFLGVEIKRVKKDYISVTKKKKSGVK